MAKRRSGYIVDRRGKKTLRSFNINVGEIRTSVRLSPTVLKAVARIAEREGCDSDQLYTYIDLTKEKGLSRATAIRDFVTRYFMDAATEAGHRKAGHGKLLGKKTVVALLCLFLLAMPARSWASQDQLQTLRFEKAIDGATIAASGRTIVLWGVKAPEPADPVAFAAREYLATMLKRGSLRCAERFVSDGLHTMKCSIDAADVGSALVQMGLAAAADPYYLGEERLARAEHRGLWRIEGADGQ